MMERKIGDIFTFKGKQYKVIESFCSDCDLLGFCTIDFLRDIRGGCVKRYRIDNKEVCFKLVKEKE